MNKDTKKKSHKTSWKDFEPKPADKESFKTAVVEYAIDHNLDAKHISPSLQPIIRILPTLAGLDGRWRSIDYTNFRIHRHDAHRSFYDTARNLIKNKKMFQALIDKRRDEDQAHSSDANDGAHGDQ